MSVVANPEFAIPHRTRSWRRRATDETTRPDTPDTLPERLETVRVGKTSCGGRWPGSVPCRRAGFPSPTQVRGIPVDRIPERIRAALAVIQHENSLLRARISWTADRGLCFEPASGVPIDLECREVSADSWQPWKKHELAHPFADPGGIPRNDRRRDELGKLGDRKLLVVIADRARPVEDPRTFPLGGFEQVRRANVLHVERRILAHHHRRETYQRALLGFPGGIPVVIAREQGQGHGACLRPASVPENIGLLERVDPVAAGRE